MEEVPVEVEVVAFNGVETVKPWCGRAVERPARTKVATIYEDNMI